MTSLAALKPFGDSESPDWAHHCTPMRLHEGRVGWVVSARMPRAGLEADRELADRLRAARESAGLSQGEVARELDMHRPTISEIEAARRCVIVSELVAFSRLYRVPVAQLCGVVA